MIGESGGSRGLTLTGGGQLVLANSNSFSGGVTINGGFLQTTAERRLAAARSP